MKSHGIHDVDQARGAKKLREPARLITEPNGWELFTLGQSKENATQQPPAGLLGPTGGCFCPGS